MVVDERSVGAAEIFGQDVVARRRQAKVLTADLFVGQKQPVAFAPDHKGCAQHQVQVSAMWLYDSDGWIHVALSGHEGSGDRRLGEYCVRCRFDPGDQAVGVNPP